MCNTCHRRGFLGRAFLAGLTFTLIAPRIASATNFRLLAREDWGAVAPLKGLVDHLPKAVLIHHTAVLSRPQKKLAAKMKSLQVFSQSKEKLDSGKIKPAWPDVPYHFVIDSFGVTAEGRDPLKKGDTNTDYDPSGYLQIALEGDFTREFAGKAQLDATVELVHFLIDKYMLPKGAVYTHNEKASTACPGENLVAALNKTLSSFR